MLDITNNIVLSAAKTSIEAEAESKSQALLIRGCNVYIFSANRIYSEFDEMTFDSLNVFFCPTCNITVHLVFSSDHIFK